MRKKTLKSCDKIDYLYLLPAVAVIIIMLLYPLLANLKYSFIKYHLTDPSRAFVGFDNYINALGNPEFYTTLGRTMVWTISVVIFTAIFGVITALLMNRKGLSSKLIKAFILIPWILPELVSGYTWKWMLSSTYGIINHGLSALGIIPVDFSWFTDPALALTVAIFVNIWRGVPFVTIMIYAKLKVIPAASIEAATVDGADHYQIFFHITLPFISAQILNCAMLVFVWTFNAFGIIYSLTGGGPAGQTETISYLVQKTAFRYFKFSDAATFSMLMFTILAIVVMLMNLASTFVKSKGDFDEN
ncbi:MAG: sugar ABC transporter permease [Spirochaetia bacterium]|nr:sugar ABC transporter permease [Spirochaetia bacterium]